MSSKKKKPPRLPVHEGSPLSMPFEISKESWERLKNVFPIKRVEKASAVCILACQLVEQESVWAALLDLGGGHSSARKKESKAWQRTLRETAGSLKHHADKLGSKAPWNERWETDDSCGRAVEAIRVVEAAANELLRLECISKPAPEDLCAG